MNSNNSRRPRPPAARQIPVLSHWHGQPLDDAYAWLRAANWQDVLRDPAALPPPVQVYLQAENRYASAMLAASRPLQRVLVREMRGRLDATDADPPAPHGPFAYYARQRKGGEHGLYCRKPRGGGAEDILLDADSLAKGKDFFALHGVEPSPDHRLLAWSLDDNGSEICAIRVRDIASGADRGDVVRDAEGHVVWTLDSRAFYYVRLDAQHRPTSVWLHRLGDAQAMDRQILLESDPGWFVTLRATRSGRIAVISIKDHDASENHLLDLRDASARPQLVAPREPGLRYEVEQHGEALVIRTNADGADDFKIAVTPLETPGRAHWRDLEPHRSGRMITSLAAFEHHLAWMVREDGLPRIEIRDMRSGAQHAIAFDEAAYALGFGEMLEFETATLRFQYSSMTTPQEIYDYDMNARSRVLLKRVKVPSGHNPADYVTRRVYAPAPDGESVPVTLLYRRGLALDGTAPVLLNGYGAYGFAREASFVPERLTLADRGFIYAIAHVRGGTDKGWRWYAGGKLANKANTFTDFIAAAQHLIARRFTAPRRIVAQGGSAGGMLMGAVANLAPELFAGIIADVPFVDVLNTMLDASLPLTPPEWLEWGNPIADAAAYERIRALCPYQNVGARAYPPILVLAGLTDPRVTYWEPAKWVARLRAAAPQAGPYLLRTNMRAGHGGASGRFARLQEIALEYAFAISLVEAAHPAA